jgi:holliday junction DNA helicase RuvA
MIGFLSGTIHTKNIDSIILLVGGVGYAVNLPPATLSKLTTGSSEDLYIHTHVREDQLELFGFRTSEEIGLFRILMSVSGVGAKTALLVVDRGVDPVRRAIMEANVDFFTTVPRLGRKNAQKIIIELKNKLGSVAELDLGEGGSDNADIEAALMSMGYSRPEIRESLKDMPSDLGSVEKKLRYALQQLAK